MAQCWRCLRMSVFLQLVFSWPLPTLFVLLLWHGSLRRSWLGSVSFALLCVLKTVRVLGNEGLVFPWETTSRGVSLHMEVLGYRFWSISTILVVSRFYFQVIIPKGSPLVTYWMFPQASLDFIFWLEWVVTCLVQFKFYPWKTFLCWNQFPHLVVLIYCFCFDVLWTMSWGWWLFTGLKHIFLLYPWSSWNYSAKSWVCNWPTRSDS